MTTTPSAAAVTCTNTAPADGLAISLSHSHYDYDYDYDYHDTIENLRSLFKQESLECYQPVGDALDAMFDNSTNFQEKEESSSCSSAGKNSGLDAFSRHEFFVNRMKIVTWAYSSTYDTSYRNDGWLRFTTSSHSLTRYPILYRSLPLAVVDHFGMSREIVTIAMNFSDRCVILQDAEDHNDTTDDSICFYDPHYYQLVAFTAVFLATKLHNGSAEPSVTLDVFCQLSKGLYNKQKAVSMEQRMLETLGWRLHPPTPKVLVHYVLQFWVPRLARSPRSWRRDYTALYEEAALTVERSVQDVSTVGSFAPSVIAMAAICNAAGTLYYGSSCSSENRTNQIATALWDGNPLQVTAAATGHVWDYALVMECCRRLYTIMGNVYEQRHHPELVRRHNASCGGRGASKVPRTQSPVSVVNEDITTMPIIASSSTDIVKIGKAKTTADAAYTALHHPS